MVESNYRRRKGDFFLWNCDSNWIDNQALSLESVFTGDYKSKITTTHGIYYSSMTVHDLLNKACIRYASTMEGRMQATRIFMKYPNKTPILIEPSEIGAFPTMSYQHQECVWLFNHHFEVEELDKGKSLVTFRNGTSIIVFVSKHVLLKQQHRLHFTLDTYRILQRDKKPYIGNDPKPKLE
ncbi:MAG TPA: competence protein ComK [Paenisporosarcina sp.]|nr:competence protein ComK [Paenisporosarcina sp.]